MSSDLLLFVHRGTSRITPRVLGGVHKKLPLLKIEFAQINAPKYPHLFNQLEFLADVVEDFAEGADLDISYNAVAGAVFALIYAHRQFDLIPDTNTQVGHADDSGVVRAVLMDYERDFSAYAARHGMNWELISLKP
ncbi:MAG: hypothetical protein FJ404_14180 [Verrucomicrobia bacterium]|nr:hypothetical protein [Verrucomicrobiota bacterium]